MQDKMYNATELCEELGVKATDFCPITDGIACP